MRTVYDLIRYPRIQQCAATQTSKACNQTLRKQFDESFLQLCSLYNFSNRELQKLRRDAFTVPKTQIGIRAPKVNIPPNPKRFFEGDPFLMGIYRWPSTTSLIYLLNKIKVGIDFSFSPVTSSSVLFSNVWTSSGKKFSGFWYHRLRRNFVRIRPVHSTYFYSSRVPSSRMTFGNVHFRTYILCSNLYCFRHSLASCSDVQAYPFFP